MEVKYKDSNKKIFSPIRNKWLEALPEEKVRQEFVCKLVDDYGYSLEQMDEEVVLTNSQRGTGKASADLVIWKTKAEKRQNKTAFLVVELKADTLKLKVEDCYQGYNYATWSRAKLFAVSNGNELQVYKTIEDELPLKLQPVNDIPTAETILDDKKLTEALAKTKEFTGEEFAKLLHKCHNIIRNNDKLSPEASFDEISKILFIKIMYERSADRGKIFALKEFNRLKNNHKELTQGTEEEGSSFIQKRFEQVKSKFKEDGIFDDNEKIKIRETSFEAIVKELEIYNLTSTSADVKGIAFERFLGRTFRGELGQFFTPRTIVDFIVDLLQPAENELICDPCAGSGGFLIKVFETIKNQIDNEYISLKTDKQKEIFGKDLENIDDEKLNQQYQAFESDTNKKQEKRIANLSHKSIFGTDANPRMARVSKMNMIMHGDGHNGIHHNDGLLNINGIFRGRFDVIITNPPFGTNLAKDSPTVEEDDRYTNQAIIKKYQDEYGEDTYNQEIKQVTDNIGKPIRKLFKVGETSGATEVLFIERCLDLLKPGGRMGIVLPEGVLNSSNLQKARDYFESRAKILLIVSLPQDVFISSGATVKTSLVFFKKFTNEEQAYYEKITQSLDAENLKIEGNAVEFKKQLSEVQKNIKKLIEAKKDRADNQEISTIFGAVLGVMTGGMGTAITGSILGNLVNAEDKSVNVKIKVLENTEIELKTQIIKIEFDYEISIADIKQAGITTTGKKGDNQLPDLLAAFAKYKKQNKLW